MFGDTTDELLRRARQDEALGWKLTREQRVLLALGDGEWHGTDEMARVNHRFGGYLHILKHDRGVEWEGEPDPASPPDERWHRYRLVKRDNTGTQAMF
jgi:hypothetical protein